MAHSLKHLLRLKGLDHFPMKSYQVFYTAPKRKRRIAISYTIETFERCARANQAPGPFLTEEIIRCLTELKELKEKKP